MDGLGHADRREVAVALVGEDDQVGPAALDAGRHRHRAPVRRLLHVAVEEVVGEHRAADRRDADRALAHAQLVDHLADQPVDDAVRAARAVGGRLLGQALGAHGRLALVLDLHGGVGADQQAVAAAGAVIHAGDVRVEVALRVDVTGHLEDALRAREHAEFAALAAVGVNNRRRHRRLLSYTTLDRRRMPCGRSSSGGVIRRVSGSHGRPRWFSCATAVAPGGRARATKRTGIPVCADTSSASASPAATVSGVVSSIRWVFATRPVTRSLRHALDVPQHRDHGGGRLRERPVAVHDEQHVGQRGIRQPGQRARARARPRPTRPRP